MILTYRQWIETMPAGIAAKQDLAVVADLIPHIAGFIDHPTPYVPVFGVEGGAWLACVSRTASRSADIIKGFKILKLVYLYRMERTPTALLVRFAHP
jgi:hypothetical protein